ncbi:MAG: hypothetical protein ACK5KT_06005 [Dysgonomonas sp.]
MGLFDALTKSVGKKLSSEGVTKLEKGMVRLTGSIEGREKEEVKKAPNPKISAVTWADKSGQKANKAKYGKELFIHIDTQNAYGSLLSALIVIHCDNWIEDYVALRPIMRSELFHGSGNYIEKTKFSFIPKIEWLKEPSVEESSISANIYLFCYMGYSSTEDNSYGLKQLAEAIKREDNDYRNYTAGNVKKPNIITEKEVECLKLEYGGYFYLKDGTYLDKIGKSKDVYICDSRNRDGFINPILLTDNGGGISNEVMLRIAGTAYGESGLSLEVIKRIPFAIVNRHIRGKKTNINGTLIDMRNHWDDKTYAHEFHYGAQGNGAFREFLGIKLNEKIDYEKNSVKRNDVPYMKKAIEYTIKAISYYNKEEADISFGAIGWQGLDIKTNENWKKWLYFHLDHKKNGFESWVNKYETREKHPYETVANYKGERFGTTIFWKPVK